MDTFLPQRDNLSRTIQEQAAVLLERLTVLPVEKLGMPYHCLEYFKSSHFKRLYFSIETSAHLLYRSITLKGKPVHETVIMDYGAGVGTLYMLAKMIGCKTVIYNDHLEDWKKSAMLIANAIGVNIDEYIVGDVQNTLENLATKNIQCDIITSRNVIEHIYKLDTFFSTVYSYQPGALIYSSTTANYHNPASHIKHILWHRKWEKYFLPQRKALIREKIKSISERDLLRLAKATRGLALQDFDNAVKAYQDNGTLPDPSIHHTNTVETGSGVWFEHLLPFDTYRKLVSSAQYDLFFEPGFWDTHNTSKAKNLLGKVLNPVVRASGKSGIKLAPFIYVIAVPKSNLIALNKNKST
ncbi:methyltransferase domain-containing protein [Flavitalea antarctica]